MDRRWVPSLANRPALNVMEHVRSAFDPQQTLRFVDDLRDL